MSVKAKYCVGIFLASILLTGSSVVASAQTISGCFVAPARMADSDIAAFGANPDSLLSTYPMAGLPMSTQVRSLSGSSFATLDGLLSLVKSASSAQKAAIGGGLGRAVKSCQTATPDYAQLIQQKVAAANDPDLTAAFVSAVNDIQTASLGGAGGAGGAAGLSGGGTTTGSSGGTIGGDLGVKQTTDDYSVGRRAAYSRTVNETNIISPF